MTNIDALELRLTIARIQSRAFREHRALLVRELQERVRDGAELISEGKTTAAEAFRMVYLQCLRIDAFDAAVAAVWKGQIDL